jgi:hypothetical protein
MLDDIVELIQAVGCCAIFDLEGLPLVIADLPYKGGHRHQC